MARETVAVWSCPHCPYQRPESVEWLLSVLPSVRPLHHLVCLGDLFESAAASVHFDEHDHILEDEYASASALLQDVRESVPRTTKKWWLLGNHDDNLQHPDPRRIPKALRSLIHWNDHKEFGGEFRRWYQIPYIKSLEGCLQLGQIILAHGFDCGVNSDELEAVQLAHICGGFSRRLVVRGHTHRPREPTQCHRTRTAPLPLWCANVGTLGPLQPPWMSRRSSFLWGPALLVASFDPTPDYNVEQPQWTAELMTP